MSETISGPRVAERLYYDSDELNFRARVSDIRLVATERGEANEASQLWQVALDRTAFYPESGGQPWDTGVLIATARSGAVLEVPVERVEEDEGGEVWHFVRKPLVEGTEVEGRVDPWRRMDHMQQHSGQHLLSAVFFNQTGARTVSFHLGVQSSTVDLELPDAATGLNSEHVIAAETEANRLIFEDRLLVPHWFSQSDAEGMLARGEIRKLPERTGPIRILEMQGVEWNACGGTHVRSTGAIGGLAVRRVEKVRRAWRVEFLCGLRAVKNARRDFAVLSEAGGLLTVGTTDVPERIASLQVENKSARKELQATLLELAEAKTNEFLGSVQEGGVIQVIFRDKPIEFAKRLASLSAAAGRSAVVGLIQGSQASVVLAIRNGEGRHAGNLLRELAPVHGGRGGGGTQMAQGVCDPAQLEAFVDKLALAVV